MHVSRITAHHAPSILSIRKSELIFNVNLWQLVLWILLYWVDLKLANSVLQSLCLILYFFDIFFIHLTFSMRLSFLSLTLSFQCINSGLVQAHIINHVLNYAEDVLILIGKGHFHSAVVS